MRTVAFLKPGLLIGVTVCLAFIVAAIPAPAQAARYGRVVYALTRDRSGRGAADIYERDLDTGKTKLLISSKAFPKEFKGTAELLEVSSAHLVIPTNPLIARVHAPGGAAVLKNAEDLWGGFFGLNQVTQLGAEGCWAAQVVVAFEEV